MQMSLATMATSYTLWLVAGSSFVVLVVFTIVIGVGYGGFIALSPAATAVMFGTTGLGAILGALYTGAAIGGLLGPPIAESSSTASRIVPRSSWRWCSRSPRPPSCRPSRGLIGRARCAPETGRDTRHRRSDPIG
jgi:MFS family permease